MHLYIAGCEADKFVNFNTTTVALYLIISINGMDHFQFMINYHENLKNTDDIRWKEIHKRYDLLSN